MSLIYFHRFLIFCSILFAGFFAWTLYGRWQVNEDTSMLVGASVALAVALGLALYLPTIKARPRSGGKSSPSES